MCSNPLKKTVFMLPSPRRWSLAAAEASLYGWWLRLADLHKTSSDRTQGSLLQSAGVFLIFIEFYRLLLWSESGVCRRRLTDVRRRRVISSCSPRFCGSGAEEEQRRCGSAGWRGSRWFSPVWWMTHLASGSREGKQTDLVVTVQELVHGAPLRNFTLEWVPIGRKHPNVSWTHLWTDRCALGFYFVILSSLQWGCFYFLCVRPFFLSWIFGPTSCFRWKTWTFFFCSFVSARLHLIRQHLINDYEQKDTQRHPLHTKLSFNVSTCALISVLMVIWGQRSEETGVKPGELALMVLHGPFFIKFGFFLNRFHCKPHSYPTMKHPNSQLSSGASWVGSGFWLGCLLGTSLWRFSRPRLDPVIYHVWLGTPQDPQGGTGKCGGREERLKTYKACCHHDQSSHSDGWFKALAASMRTD